MPASKEAEKLTIVQSSLAIAVTIFELIYIDPNLAALLHPFNFRRKSGPEGIDFSEILENAEKGNVLIKLTDFAFENDPSEKREHFQIPEYKRYLTELRFGRIGGIPMTYREICDLEGLTLSSVGSQVITTINRLRQPRRSDPLKNFLEENHAYKFFPKS